MSDLLNLAVAMGLPWLAGMVVVARCFPLGSPGRVPAIAGYGFFLGILGAAFILMGLELATGTWRYWSAQIAILVVGVLAAALNRRYLPALTRPTSPTSEADPSATSYSLAWRVLCVILVALIITRIGQLTLEVIRQPVYAWDSWDFWTHRARAFHEAGEWVPPARFGDWLVSAEPIYTNDAYHPALVSVLQLWPALALGRWDEAFIHLPWVAALVALGVALYGQLRAAGLPVAWGLAAMYALVSLPAVNAHTVLAGYADLWIGGVAALAAMSLYVVFQRRDLRQAPLLLLCIPTVVWMKQAGMLTALAIVAAIVLGTLSVKAGIGLVAATFLAVAGWALTAGIDVTVPALGRLVVDTDTFVLPHAGTVGEYEVWQAWLQRLFLDDTWHLLIWLYVVIFAAGLPLALRERSHRSQLVLGLAVFAVFFVAFSFSRHAAALQEGTGINRHLMQFALPMLFWAFVVAYQRLGTRIAGQPR